MRDDNTSQPASAGRKADAPKAFMFYKDWAELLLEMPSQLRTDIVTAILRYVTSGDEPADPSIKFSAFAMMKRSIERDTSKYAEKSQRSRTAAQARWRASEKDADAYKRIPQDAQDADAYKRIQIKERDLCKTHARKLAYVLKKH